MTTSNPLILAVIEDLFFLVQVQDAAAKAGCRVVTAKSAEEAAEKSAEAALTIVDLQHAGALGAIEAIKALPRDAKHGTRRILAFVPHVQTELRRKAAEAGADQVVARSAFAQKLGAALSAIMEAECGTAIGSPPGSSCSPV